MISIENIVSYSQFPKGTGTPYWAEPHGKLLCQAWGREGGELWAKAFTVVSWEGMGEEGEAGLGLTIE